MAPVAQERLLALERTNAPPIELIQEASLFAGISFIEISKRYIPAKPPEVVKAAPKVGSHGRQEYVLRWLLKKLQDEETRCCAAAWRLLKRLTDLVPPRNLARVLHERKFVLVLRQALEEAVAARNLVDGSSDTAIGSPITGKSGSVSSKKRNRNGNLLSHVPKIESVAEESEVFAEWKSAVYEVVNRIALSSKSSPYLLDTSGSEYLKSTIRTSNVDAAKILGGWLALCGTQNETVAIATEASLLPPFLEIWDTRILGPEDVKVFARYCLSHSVKIMSTTGQQSEQTAQLERLLAHSILIPAKKAYGSSKDANSLASLVGDVVSKIPESAPIIFNTAIRCIQRHGSHSRTADDTDWLHSVIGALQEAISSNVSGSSVDALNKMLRHCIDRKFALELPFLRLITSQYGLPSGSTNWDLLATIIELDSNTFLIPSDTEDLLKDMLVRITDAGTEATWPTTVDSVVDKVLAPLMGEFSKARQLTAFIRHWYEQLAEFDKFLRRSGKGVEHFSAWEDEALRVKLEELLEQSLTTLQIVEIVAWLVEKLKECEGVACVLLDAVAGAVSDDDTKAALYPMLKEEVINVLVYTGPDDRYKARLLHLNTVVLNWSAWQNFDDVSPEQGNSPLLLNLLSSEISFPDRDHSLTALEAFRYLCSQWSIWAPRFQDHLPGTTASDTVIETLSTYISSVGSHIQKVVEQLPEVRKLVEQRWEGRVLTIKRDLSWLACAYASCILVEYPQVLELCMEGQMLTHFIWISSTVTPTSSLNREDPWLPLSHPGLPSMWIKMLRYDGYVENNKKLSQHIIDRMIECATHSGNPIEGSKAANGFVVMCFHHLPLELLSKYNREAILKAWPPEPFDPSLFNGASLLYKMAPLDSAILSLKAKMFQVPTLYNGIDIRELVDIAKCIELSRREPKIQLDIYAEIPELILGHVFATIDQPKSLKYIQGTKETLGAWLEENRNTKKVLSYAMIRLVQVVLTTWTTKITSTDEFSKALKETTNEFLATFRGLLLSNLQLRLQNPAKLAQDDSEHCMSLYSTMDALDAITVRDRDLINLQADTLSTLDSLKRLNPELGKRLEPFMAEHYPDIFGEPPKKLLEGDVSTYTGREAIRRKALAVAKQMTDFEKLQVVDDVLDELGDEEALDKLLAVKHIIDNCEDLRAVAFEGDDLVGHLSTSYSSLAIRLAKSESYRRCWLICDILAMILREKPRTITQYNIDTTLASITVICSRGAPILNPSSASTIYYGLVDLANAVLTNHRLKLQGHFHIVIQTIQSLLYCLFIPSSSGTHSSTKIHSFPPWITAGTGTGSLGAGHAKVFTRLLTLICDPSVSAVSRPSSSSRDSAIKKAKALAGQHMPFVLSAYIRAQLDMSLIMKQEIRETLVPGWYAIFDTMTVEGRKALGEGMDASGRAILSGLVKDWLRFGKWNGA